MIRVAVVGFGYWGPNLVRNFFGRNDCVVVAIVDSSPEKLQKAGKLYPNIRMTTSYDEILNDTSVDAVIIALPVSFHYDFAKKALENGKHVLVEKPMTDSKEKAVALHELALKKKKIIMVDHTYLYTDPVKKIRKIVTDGEIGEIQYFDSVRINLGLFQHDVNVIWDLAPHDISMLAYLINEKPHSITASGISHNNNGIENIAYMTLFYTSNKIAHFSVSWTSPVKIRKILIGGTKKMVVFDDLESTEKLKIYDTGYKLTSKEDEHRILVDYRVGDIWIPKVDETEA